VDFSSPSTWPYYLYFYRDEAPSADYPPYSGSGTNSDFDNLYSTFSVGESTECWYDPVENEVYFEKPNEDGKVDANRGWIGAGFGIAFFLIGIVLLVLFCLTMQKRYESGRSRAYKDYKDQEMTHQSGQQGQSSMPVAHAVAVPM
tara:strand:+ start:354 stop:788 length:435 start_codon:yes stop_codon:yes gene_type:complete